MPVLCYLSCSLLLSVKPYVKGVLPMSALYYLPFMPKIGCHGPLLFQPESIAHAHYFLQFSHMLGCLAHASLMLSFIYAKIGCHGPLVVQHESIAQMVPMPPLTCHLQSPNIGWPLLSTISGKNSIWCSH